MSQAKHIKTAVLKTLCYSDIFGYPLRAEEIHRFLINEQKVSLPDLLKAIDRLKKEKLVFEKQGYWFLADRQELIKVRKKRKKYSQAKIKIARRAAAFMKTTPTIQMIALTGALAMENSGNQDDIDLLITTSRNRLWLTRALTVLKVPLIAKRRRPVKPGNYTFPETSQAESAKEWSNAICLNLWLDETALSIPKPQRNLYTAHEVVQMKPIFSKDSAYEKFLSQNFWVTKFLANTKIPKTQRTVESPQDRFRLRNSWVKLVDKLENLTFHLQLLYMKPKMTRELVTARSAFFHPRDTRGRVMEEYRGRVKKFGLEV